MTYSEVFAHWPSSGMLLSDYLQSGISPLQCNMGENTTLTCFCQEGGHNRNPKYNVRLVLPESIEHPNQVNKSTVKPKFIERVGEDTSYLPPPPQGMESGEGLESGCQAVDPAAATPDSHLLAKDPAVALAFYCHGDERGEGGAGNGAMDPAALT